MIWLLSFGSLVLSDGPACRLSSLTKEHTETKSTGKSIPVRRYVKPILAGSNSQMPAQSVNTIQRSVTAMLIIAGTGRALSSPSMLPVASSKAEKDWNQIRLTNILGRNPSIVSRQRPNHHHCHRQGFRNRNGWQRQFCCLENHTSNRSQQHCQRHCRGFWCHAGRGQATIPTLSMDSAYGCGKNGVSVSYERQFRPTRTAIPSSSGILQRTG